MNDKSLHELEERAAEAQSVLQHPLIGEALTEYTHQCMAALIGNPIGNPDSLAAQAGLQAVQSIQAHLVSVVNKYKVAKKYEEKRNG